MKRPEGFDPAPKQSPATPKATRRQRAAVADKLAGREPTERKPTVAERQNPESHCPEPTQPESKQRVPLRLRQRIERLRPEGLKPERSRPETLKPQRQEAASSLSRRPGPSNTPSPAVDSAKAARRAARERRRYERDEVRRFTRRSRHRRAAWVTAIAVVVALVGTVTIAVYSPILALTKIEITGTASVDPAEVLQAVDGQLGTPLALVDSARLTRELQKFPLIQSYVTETVPPHTLIIHVTERKPIGSLVTAAGFTVVDPAGVTISESSTRPEGVPAIELAGADVDSAVFDSVVEVLLALPDSVAPRVDRITAATQDDVTLVFSGAGQRVVWGSAEDSGLKARVLAALMATQAEDAAVEYDVSAPLSAVIRPV